MSDVIVVFGSVTSDQYPHLYKAMSDQGLQPAIVRFDPSEECKDNFTYVTLVHPFHSSNDPTLSDEQNLDQAHADIEREMQEYAQSVLGEFRLDDIKTIVFPHTSDADDWLWFVGQLSDDVATYTVQVSETNPELCWLVGDGFGSSLPALDAEAEEIANFLDRLANDE